MGVSNMELIKSILELIISLVSLILTPLSLPADFLAVVDGAISFVIDIIHFASWLLPVNIILICLSAIWVVDNWAIIWKIVKWVLELIRG